MDELHNKPINGEVFVLEEGQGGSLCSNKESFPCPSLSVKPYLLSADALNSLEELGNVLRRINTRMKAEGYLIVDGIVTNKNDTKNI
jgi:hypothetical protein